MIQKEIVEISGWRLDSEVYPEGAREKRTVFAPDSVKHEFIKPEWRYMFKLSSHRYPEQFWAEIISYQIALMIDVPCPPAYVGYDSSRNQAGALSEWFYQEGDAEFYHAGNFFPAMVDGFDRDKGQQHNYYHAYFLHDRLTGSQPSMLFDFYSMFLFDAIIGNTDRHQDNWGYMLRRIAVPKSKLRKVKNSPAYSYKARLAPFFDNGTSLGHEIMERKFSCWRDEDMERYIERGKHHVRHSIDRLERIGHLDYFRDVKARHSGVTKFCLGKLARFDCEAFRTMLDSLVMIEVPDGGALSASRADFIYRLTMRRVEKILGVLR